MAKLLKKPSVKSLSRRSSQRYVLPSPFQTFARSPTVPSPSTLRTLHSPDASRTDLPLSSVEEGAVVEPKSLIRRLCGVFATGSAPSSHCNGKPQLTLHTNLSNSGALDSDNDTLVSTSAHCRTKSDSADTKTRRIVNGSSSSNSSNSSAEPLHMPLMSPAPSVPQKPRSILSESQLALLLLQHDSDDSGGTSLSSINRHSTVSRTSRTQTGARDYKHHRHIRIDPHSFHGVYDSTPRVVAVSAPPCIDGGDGRVYATKLRPPPWHLKRRRPGALAFDPSPNEELASR